MDADYFPSCTYLLAQQLNNSAARCIEIGHYGRAMSSLKKALEINKKSKKQQTNFKSLDKITTCYQLVTLDGCIAYSENNRSAASALKTSSTDDGRSAKKRKVDTSNDETNEKRDIFWRPPSEDGKCNSSTTTTRQGVDDGYIYCQPIRVNFEDGDMGGTLFLIIIFNMALAHHLEALGAHNAKRKGTIVRKTLSLYELTHKCYLKLLGNDDNKEESSSSSSSSWVSGSYVVSFRFNMIIQNNISQLHRLVNDHSKYDRCRQHLLSSVMVVLDYNTRVKSGENSSSSNNNTSTSTTSSWDPRAMGIEGFLTNTTSLILGDTECAEAA